MRGGFVWHHFACAVELCQVTPEMCAVAQLLDFLIVCLTDAVAPVVVGCQQASHLGTGVINEDHKVYQRDVLMIQSSNF